MKPRITQITRIR